MEKQNERRPRLLYNLSFSLSRFQTPNVGYSSGAIDDPPIGWKAQHVQVLQVILLICHF